MSRITRLAATAALAVSLTAGSGLAYAGTDQPDASTPRAADSPTPDGPNPLIVGGRPVTVDQMRRLFPGVASFQIYNPYRQVADWHTCTTTAIAPPPRRTTGTAAELAADAALQREIDRHSAALGGRATRWAWLNAHCFTNDDATAWDPVEWDMHLRIGSTDRTSGGRVVRVIDAIPHEGWAWGTVPGAPVHDAGLLVLDRWIRAGATIAASPGKHGLAKTAGWGLLQPDDETAPTVLQQIDYAAPANPRQCTGADLGITANEVCGETRPATGVSRGDSSGPLTKKATDGTWRLVGSTSRYGASEAPGSGADIFTDATAYRDWIRYVMAHGRTPTEPPQRTDNLRALSGLSWPDGLTRDQPGAPRRPAPRSAGTGLGQ